MRLRLFLSFTFGYFLSNFFRAANAVIAGDLTRELNLTAADLGLMTSMFYVGFAAVQLPLGSALDRFGTRFTIPIFMSLTFVGSLIFSVATSFPTVALGRTLIGIGMAGGLMGTLTAFGRWFPANRTATITGLAVGLGAAGGLVAATPLAWLASQIGWRLVFGWAAVAVLLSASMIAIFTRNAPAEQPFQPAKPGTGPGFNAIFRESSFWRLVPINLFLVGTLLAVQTLWAGPYLFDVLQLQPIEAGNLLLGMSGGLALGYVGSGWLGDRFGARPATITAVSIFSLCQIAFLLPTPLSPLGLLPVYALFGFTGAFNLLLLTQVRNLFPATLAGRAVTALNLFGFGGAAFIQWLMGVIIGSFPLTADGRHPPIAYISAFSLTLTCTVLSLLWYLAGKRQTP